MRSFLECADLSALLFRGGLSPRFRQRNLAKTPATKALTGQRTPKEGRCAFEARVVIMPVS